MNVPFLRPPLDSYREKYAVINIMNSKNLSVGPETIQFEQMFKNYIGVPYALSVCNGTIALELIWQTFITNGKLKPGDKVLVPSFTFVAVANSIINSGLTPVFCDIRRDTWNLQINGFEIGINDIKAICAVHTFGTPCEIDTLKSFCNQFGVLLVEDCAEACGAMYNGKRVGSFGDAASFSFNTTKNLTTGEGGMVCLQHEDDARTALLLKENGFGYSTSRNAQIPGHNYRLSNLQCAIGIEQLKTLDLRNRQRLINSVEIYKRLLDVEDSVFPQRCFTYTVDVRQILSFIVPKEKRDEIYEYLISNGIECKKYFDPPVHRQDAYKKYYTKLPVTDEISSRIIALPFDDKLSFKEIGYMTDKLLEII